MQYMPQPDDVLKGAKERATSHVTLIQRFQPLFQDGEQDLTITSLGEYLLPFFLAAVEACWLNGVLIGLASLKLLDSNVALLPFWGTPLLLLGSIWLFRRALQKETSAQTGDAEDGSQSLLQIPGLRLMFGLIGLLTLFLIWLQIYSASAFLFDPNWLLAFVGDILALNMHFYQALFIVGFAIGLCWWGMRVAQITVEPGMVFKQIWIGLLVFLVAILLRANHASTGGNADDVILLLLIPIFLYLALSTHALARVSWIRRDHPFGLQGSVMAQERAMLSVIALVGLVLLVLTIIGGSLFSPTFFNAWQPIWQAISTAYDWLTTLFSQFAAFIITPFIWLATWWFSLFPNKFPTIRTQQRVAGNPKHLLQLGATSPGIVTATKILVPLLILLALILLVRWALRKRKRVRVSLNRHGGDVHESVWSWRLFWGQLRGVLQAFLARLFPKRASSEDAQQREDLATPPSARTIRQIYRALLKKSASRGQIRKRDETPYEFQARLNQHEPQNEPQLGMLTEAYALTRYGGGVPSEHELATIRQFWNELEQKWEVASS